MVFREKKTGSFRIIYRIRRLGGSCSFLSKLLHSFFLFPFLFLVLYANCLGEIVFVKMLISKLEDSYNISSRFLH